MAMYLSFHSSMAGLCITRIESRKKTKNACNRTTFSAIHEVLLQQQNAQHIVFVRVELEVSGDERALRPR